MPSSTALCWKQTRSMNSALDGPAADQPRVSEQECSGCQYIREEIERRNALVAEFERTHDCRFAEITREGTAALIDDWHAHLHRDHINKEHFDAETPTSVPGRDGDAPARARQLGSGDSI